MPEKKGPAPLTVAPPRGGYLGEAGNVELSPTNTHRAVDDLLDQGWTEQEVEEALRRQRGSGFFDDNEEYIANGSGRVEETRVQDAMAYIPISDIPDVPLLDKIKKTVHRLADLTFTKKRRGGVGFKVTSDAYGRNAIVSKVKDPALLEKGLCVGAIVTHIEDIEVIGMDHFEILENYRNCMGEFSMVFAVPGLKHHRVEQDVVRKSGHKLTVLMLAICLLLSITALSTNLIQTSTIKDFPVAGTNTEVRWHWDELSIKQGNTWTTVAYDSLESDTTYGGEYKTVKKTGGLFFGFTIASVVMYIFLMVLAVIFATRRPRSLIAESGEFLRSSFIILNMVVCITTLVTFAAWISQFSMPNGIPNPTKLSELADIKDHSVDHTIKESLVLEILAFAFMFFSVFTAIVQK